MNKFYFDKSTNTFADELLVAGFSTVIANIAYQLGQMVQLTQQDLGAVYQLTCEPPIDWEQAQQIAVPFYPFPILRTEYANKSLPDDLPEMGGATVVYDEAKRRNEIFWEQFKLLEGAQKAAFAQGEDVSALQHAAPHPHWDIFRLINPAALLGYNALAVQWIEIGRAGLTGTAIKLLADLFTQSPNAVAITRKAWQKIAKEHGWKMVDVTASQFFNPAQGKGINKALPNGVGLANLKTFWLVEWLKVIGFFEISLTRTLKGSKDRKTYVPVFGQMDRYVSKTVFDTFKKTMRFSETAVRSDIFTVLRYVQAMLKYGERASQPEDIADETGDEYDDFFSANSSPADYVRGFQVAFYKDLGNAVTTMNLSFLNLPGWIKFAANPTSDHYQPILNEHEAIMRDLDESKGDQLDLLTLYRDFIVADHLDPFLDFTTAYSSYLISQGEKAGFPPKKFTTANLRRLILDNQSNLSDILNSQGFINIAYAIRQSTVTAQYRKKQNDRRYDVRYGLGRDLVRNSQYPTDFLAELSDFLGKYNAENAQVMENRPGPYRKSIQTEDIKEIAALIDKYDSNLIAKLLVAYGYARDSRNVDFDNSTEDSDQS